MGDLVVKHQHRRGMHLQFPRHNSSRCSAKKISLITLNKIPVLQPKTQFITAQSRPANFLLPDTIAPSPDSLKYQMTLAKLPESLKTDYPHWLKSRRLAAVAITAASTSLVLMATLGEVDDPDSQLGVISGIQIFAAAFGIMAWKASREVKNPKAFKNQKSLKGVLPDGFNGMHLVLILIGGIILIPLLIYLVANIINSLDSNSY